MGLECGEIMLQSETNRDLTGKRGLCFTSHANLYSILEYKG